MTGTIGDCIYGFKVALSNKKGDYNESRINRSINAFSFLFKVSIAIGIIEFLAGAISISKLMSNLLDFGPNFAIALIRVFYSLIIAFMLILPAKLKLQLWKDDHKKY